MGCLFSVSCFNNSKIAVFVSEKEYTRAYSWQLNLLQRGTHPMPGLQSDFASFGPGSLQWRCHEVGLEKDELEERLLEYAIEHFMTYRPELGYNQELASHAPPEPEPMPVPVESMSPAERAHRLEMESMRSEMEEMKSLLAEALGMKKEVEPPPPAQKPVVVEPPDDFDVPEELSDKPKPGVGKPVLRLEVVGKNSDGEDTFAITSEFPSISAAARDCKGTSTELRRAISNGKLYNGCRWVFKDAEAAAA